MLSGRLHPEIATGFRRLVETVVLVISNLDGHGLFHMYSLTVMRIANERSWLNIRMKRSGGYMMSVNDMHIVMPCPYLGTLGGKRLTFTL